jgi:hypothetical protein
MAEVKFHGGSRSLASDFSMIRRMEDDLKKKATDAMQSAGIAAKVHGVYSLDDLERKQVGDLESKIAIGIQYRSCYPSDARSSDRPSASPAGDKSVRMLSFEFLVILAVPRLGEGVEEGQERHDAVELLTVLRLAILGSVVDNDRSTRRWNFVSELPEIEESNVDVDYWSQRWAVTIPQTGSLAA